MNTIVTILIGLICGILTGIIIHITEKTQGVFLVNTTDPNKDVYRIEFTIPLGAITKHRVIHLRVIDESKSRE